MRNEFDVIEDDETMTKDADGQTEAFERKQVRLKSHRLNKTIRLEFIRLEFDEKQTK